MKESKVIVKVKGGIVSSVFSNIHNLEVIILDYDTEDWTDRQDEAENIIEYSLTQQRKGNTAVDFVEVY